MIRAFIAVETPEAARQEIAALQEKLRRSGALKDCAGYRGSRLAAARTNPCRSEK